MGFKIGAVPFHMWVPDTYQGALDAGDRVPIGCSQSGRNGDAHAVLSVKAVPSWRSGSQR
jgi:hypothetical protein